MRFVLVSGTVHKHGALTDSRIDSVLGLVLSRFSGELSHHLHVHEPGRVSWVMRDTWSEPADV